MSSLDKGKNVPFPAFPRWSDVFLPTAGQFPVMALQRVDNSITTTARVYFQAWRRPTWQDYPVLLFARYRVTHLESAESGDGAEFVQAIDRIAQGLIE